MMSKRFWYGIEDGTEYIEDYIKKDCYFDLEAVEGLLNEQQSIIQFLQDEIDELKKDIDIYKYEEKKHSESARKLYEENEQLRKTINEVIELLVEEVDLFSDKATEHYIIAYKEMNDFNNKDAYSMCISTKKAIKMLQGVL